MSAPTVLDAGALITGLAWRVHPPEMRVDAEADIYSGEEQRSNARITQLTRLHNDLCTQAVDEFEIAAGLEATGLNDRQARAEYGAASVFELARAMYDLVPTRVPPPVPPPDPWHRPMGRHLLHGLLYALPGLMYAVALSTLETGFNVVLLIGATILSAGLGQGLAVLGHVLIGRGRRDAASALFRTALVVATVLGAFAMLGGWLLEPLSPVAVLAGWQFAYILAATILMVLDASTLLLAVLAPGVVVAIVQLTGARAVSRDVALGFLALCVAAAVVAAWFKLTGTAWGTGEHLRERFGLARFDVALSSGYFFYGIATAGLISFAVVDSLTGGGNAGAGAIALMMLPLVASLGVAELLVYRLRSRAVMVLRKTSSLDEFRISARSQVARAVLIYGSVLLALTIATVLVFPQEHSGAFVLSICAYGVLGLAFLCTTLLLSLRRHRLALGFAVAALVVDSALRLPLLSASPTLIAAMHLAVFTVFLVAVLPTVTSQYITAGAHR